jgi:hypothetical protein
VRALDSREEFKIEIKMTNTGIKVTTGAKALLELISETQALLELGNFPLQILDATLGLLEGPSKLVRIKSNYHTRDRYNHRF